MNDATSIATARELATHASDILHLQDDMDRMIEEMKEIKEALHSIQKTLVEAHGGWRMLLGVGGAAALIGAIFANLFQGFWSR